VRNLWLDDGVGWLRPGNIPFSMLLFDRQTSSVVKGATIDTTMTRPTEQIPLVFASFVTGILSCFLIGRLLDRAKDAKSRASGETQLLAGNKSCFPLWFLSHTKRTHAFMHSNDIFFIDKMILLTKLGLLRKVMTFPYSTGTLIN
jgi:hypothetical protein